MRNTGRIIFLNGTSSSGKSAIAKALQETLDEYYLHVSADDFLGQFLKKAFADKEFMGRLPEFAYAFQASAAAQARAGMNVILDHVLQDCAWLDDCVDQFSGIEVCFVAIRCPLEELEKREADRGDRVVGLAKFQYDRVHKYDTYDIELDTSFLSPEQCAAAILKRISSGEPTTAFATLQRRPRDRTGRDAR